MKATEHPRIAPCPFCGDLDTRLQSDSLGNATIWFADCLACGAEGLSDASLDKAVSAWNNAGGRNEADLAARLTKREHIAALALQGLLASESESETYTNRYTTEGAARRARAMADALLAELDRTGETP